MNNDIDNTDYSIIATLKEDSRLSIRDIAKKTNLRPSTVHQRIKRLKQDDVIKKFTIKTNNDKVAEGFIVFMFIKTKPSVHLSSKVLNDNHIKEVFGITGEYDLLIKMKFKDVIEFNNFLIKFRKEQQVESTLTMVATVNLKEDF